MAKVVNLHRTSPALRQAMQAVERMHDPDTVMVPVEPSMRMAIAGARAGRIRVRMATAIWRAMVREAGR